MGICLPPLPLQIDQIFPQLQLLMNIQTNVIESESEKCKGCRLFFGSQAFKGYCSTCYKKLDSQSLIPAEKTKAADESFKEICTPVKKEEPSKPIQTDKKRCYNCRKKVGLLGIECRCGFVFCNMHRMPEDHSCSFNHEEEGKNRLEKNLIKVSHEKIDGI